MKTTVKKSRVRFPIAVKLVTIITAIVLASLTITTLLITIIIRNDVQITAEDNNFTINQRSAAETQDLLESVRTNTFLFLDIIRLSASNDVKNAAEIFFTRNKDLAAIVIPEQIIFTNNRFFLTNSLDASFVTDFALEIKKQYALSQSDGAALYSAAPLCDFPLLALAFPLFDSTNVCVTFFSAETLAENFGTGSNTSMLINRDGTILISPDFDQMKNADSVTNTPVWHLMNETSEQYKQTLIKTENGEQLFTSFYRLPFSESAVITSIPYGIVFEAIQRSTIRNIFLGMAVLFTAILLVWFFSKSISNPVHTLARAAAQIENGDFLLDIHAHTRDELGMLTDSFVQMGKGLAERENLKESFGRFTNKEIAERAMRGDLTLGGESKFVTIFFSDIRSFTSLSENMEPADLVEFLNDYMMSMVSCITETGGSVDKFIGDAIMAVWGAVSSAGSDAVNALNSVRAALKMRANLIDYNKGRPAVSAQRGMGLIKRAEAYTVPRDFNNSRVSIGCGINTGAVIAGQIGSTERMEYTVIGDAVNLASRTESLNKPFGTDILITENTYVLIKEKVTVEEMPPVSVKGKSKPVRMFAVVNIPSALDIPYAGSNGPKTLREVRKLIGMQEPDLAKVNTNEEEKKYKITG